MAKVILHGGGDGGGLIITPNGIRKIPPFDPPLLRQIHAVAAMVRAQELLTSKETLRQLTALLNKFANLVVAQVEEVAGALDADAGLIYYDDDGGFTCGSTGKPPIPIPGPLPWQDVPSVNQLVSRGLLSKEVTDFLRSAAEKKADLAALFREPKAEAKRIGVRVSAAVADQVTKLQIGDPKNIEHPVDREVVEFFHAAVADGRYLAEWSTDPQAVAAKLGFKISKDAIAKIVAASSVNLPAGPGSVMSPYAVAVVVVVVIVVWTREARVPVRDLSGIAKF